MKLIIGLGNPGLRYSATRHNIGFRVVKLLAKRHNIRINKSFCGAKLGRGLINGRRIILALPQKFMNLSGEPAKAIIDSEKIYREDLLVVCDDVNLSLGRLRLRSAGSSGGHKGLKSLIEHLNSDDFARLRIGVGEEGLAGDITDFVLGGFNKCQKSMLPKIMAFASQACESWIDLGVEKTASKFNKNDLTGVY